MRKSFLLASVFSALFCCASAQETQVADSAAGSEKSKQPKEIKSFKNLEVPDYLKEKIQRMSPDSIAVMYEEFQRNERDEYGDEYTVTVKMGFDEDHVVGYIRKAPLYNSVDLKPVTSYIYIKIKWCTSLCIDTLDTAHLNDITDKCLTFSEIKALEAKRYKCPNGWIQQTEEDAKEGFGQKGGSILPPGDKKKKNKQQVTGKTGF